MDFKIIEGPLKGLIIIENFSADKSNDNYQSYNYDTFKRLGLDVKFVQENQNVSHKGVLRGVHLQTNFPQKKLIRVATGKIFDVTVDMRKDSESYKKWFGIELSEENRKQLYIPEGFAHGFLSLVDNSTVIFKVTDFFHPGDEVGFIWNDPDINIKWPVKMYNSTGKKTYTMLDGVELILGSKDLMLPYSKTVFED